MKINGLDRKKRNIILLVIAATFIIRGLLQAILGFELDPKVTKNIDFILMIIVIVLFMSGNKKSTDDSEE